MQQLDVGASRQPRHDSSGDPLKRALAVCRKSLGTVAGFSLVMSLLALTVPIYMAQIYDRVLGSGSLDTLLMLTIICVAALALYALLDGLRMIVLGRVGARFEAELGGPLLAASIRSASRGEGSDVQALRDVSQLRNFIASPALTTIFDLPLVPLFLLIVFLIHPMLGAVTVAAAVILFLLTLANQWLCDEPLNAASQSSLRAVVRAQSYVRNAELVQALGLYPETVMRWGASNSAALRAGLDAGARNAAFSAASKFIRLLMQIALLGIGAYLTLKQEITGGVIFAASIIGARALQPIEGVIGAWRSFVQTRQSFLRMRHVLVRAGDFQPRLSLPPPKGRLDIEQLSYQPPGVRPILRNVSFSLAPGEALGLVGPAGAGKSTLARLIVGAIEPTLGKVRVDRADLVHWNRDELGGCLGYLPQHPEFFPGTIADNIARMAHGATDQAVAQAAQLSGAHDLILRLPQGYATELGASGMELSGGQKQRIGLARAFFGEPVLIVLDEPNSNLDAEGDQALNRALLGARAKGATVIIVSQRPSAIEVVDKILVLSEGQIKAFGARDAILPRIAPGFVRKQARGGDVASVAPVRRHPTAADWDGA